MMVQQPLDCFGGSRRGVIIRSTRGYECPVTVTERRSRCRSRPVRPYNPIDIRNIDRIARDGLYGVGDALHFAAILSPGWRHMQGEQVPMAIRIFEPFLRLPPVIAGSLNVY